MSGEGAHDPDEVQDQLYGTNFNSMQQDLLMDEGPANGISTSEVQMTDLRQLDETLSNFLNSDDFLANRSSSIIEIDSEETLNADNIQQDQQETPAATSELTLPPFPGELEQIFQASNPGFYDVSDPNIEVFSQNVAVLNNVAQNVEVFQNLSQNALPQPRQFSQNAAVLNNVARNVEVFQNLSQNALPLPQQFSQNVEVFHDASENAELFQSGSQDNVLPQQQQFDQFRNSIMGEDYGGSFSVAPLATQGTAVTGFNGGNFQMPTPNWTSQNRESSSSVQLPPIQQPYPQVEMPHPGNNIQQSTELQEQGLQEVHRSQRPHEMGTTSLRNLKKRIRGLQPTENPNERRASPLRNVMMKMTYLSSKNQSSDLQQGFQGIQQTRNPNSLEYSSLRNVMRGLQRVSLGESQHEKGASSLRNVTKRMHDIPSTQNPHEMGSSSLSNVVMQMTHPNQNQHSAELQLGNFNQGLQGNYPTQNWHEAVSPSSSNIMQGFQGIYPTQNQHETGSPSSSNVMQGLQGIYPAQNQHETGWSPSSNTMQGLQGIYPTQNQHEMGPSSPSYVMQGPQDIYPSQNPLELGASPSSNAMMGMNISGNNQQTVVPQVGSSLYPVTAQRNASPMGSQSSSEPLVYDPKFAQLGYPVDPYMRQLKFKGFKKP